MYSKIIVTYLYVGGQGLCMLVDKVCVCWWTRFCYCVVALGVGTFQSIIYNQF